MIPLYVEADYGTSYTRYWILNPFAVYLMACGWRTEICVTPPKALIKTLGETK